MRKILKMSEADRLKDYIGADIYARLQFGRQTFIPLENGSCFLMFHFCDISKVQDKDELVCIFCSPSELLFLTESEWGERIMGAVDSELEPYRQLFEFFIELTSDDLNIMESIEDEITGLEDGIISAIRSDAGNGANIITIRRNLLRMKRYYEQLSLVTGELAEDENGRFTQEMQKRFAYLDRRVDFLLNAVLHLREYITQVREAYQAQIDIEQNQIMKIFTVITSIFLPLTLLVGWYGMNFTSMPEYAWRFGYYYVIALSVIVFAICIVIFKRRKWY